MYYYSDPSDRKKATGKYTVTGQVGNLRGFYDDVMKLAAKWELDIDDSEN